MGRSHRRQPKTKSIITHTLCRAEIEVHDTPSKILDNYNSFNLQHRVQCTKRNQTPVINAVLRNCTAYQHEVLNFNLPHFTRAFDQLLSHDNRFNLNAQSSTCSSTGRTCFTLFSKLPLELQFKIWKIAAHHPNVIGVRDIEERTALCGTSARCQLLLTCKQSRQEVLRAKENLSAIDSSSYPKIYGNLGVDTLWLTIERGNIYDRDAEPLWKNIINGPTKKVRKLAISYSLFKRRWDDLNAMVFKLDLEELILLVDSEEISKDDMAVFVKPRSAVGRRSAVWKDWEGVARSEARQLKDCLSHAQNSYLRSVQKGVSQEELLERGKRDLSSWKLPKISICDIVNSRNARPEELAALAAEDDKNTEFDEDSDIESEEGHEYY